MKYSSGTGVAPTPSKGPQRPSKAILEGFCRYCKGKKYMTSTWGATDPCFWCNGTGTDQYEKTKE